MDCSVNCQVERGCPKGQLQFHYSQFVIYNIFIEVIEDRYNMKLFIVGTLLALANTLKLNTKDQPVLTED